MLSFDARETSYLLEMISMNVSRLTYLVFSTRLQIITHASAVAEAVSPEVEQLMFFRKLENGKRMIRAASEVGVFLGVQIGKQIFQILVFIAPELIHPIEER